MICCINTVWSLIELKVQHMVKNSLLLHCVVEFANQCYTSTCASYAMICADDDMPTCVEAKPTISRKCL
jgi:hypothetical protein